MQESLPRPTLTDAQRRRLATVRAVLFDMDGVIYVGLRPLAGVQELWDYLDATGRARLCVTNNASQSGQFFAAKLAKMGLHAEPHQLLGSAEATATWLREQIDEHARGAANGFPPAPVFVMGMEGLCAALEGQGLTLTTDPFAAGYCVAGAHFHLTYEDLAEATLAIRNGALFIGTNPDATFPTERGLIPGAGSLQAALITSTGKVPIVVGKPHAPMFRIALERLGAAAATTLMVGDRHDTDIVGAAALGLLTAGVLTGVNTRAEMEAGSPPPDFVFADLPEMLDALRAADATVVKSNPRSVAG